MFYWDSSYSNYKQSLAYQLSICIQKQIFLDNLIIDFSGHSDVFNNKVEIKKLGSFMYLTNKNFLGLKLFTNHKISNFIFIKFNFNLEINFSVCNCKYMFEHSSYYNKLLNIKNLRIYDWSEKESLMLIYGNSKSENIFTFKETLIKDFGTDDFNKILKLK